MELREGAVIADRFRLVRLLGKGGMGEVWAARHIALDIPCAVKFIHAEAAEKPEVRERFEREAKAAAQLRSPNVVQTLDYGIFEGVPYIAMEYLEGEPLSARLKRLCRLDPIETMRIVTGVGRALTKAHAAGIVHRDLKPENVYLVPDEEGEIAKVLDFGVAKRTTQLDSNTRTGALLGTPYYMSPEQAQGIRAVDHRADLWSLAVLAFRCVTGELPFKSDALGDLLIKIVTQPPPVPSHVCPGLPPMFDRWWHVASQREPEHRYQSAKDLCDALGMALGVSMGGPFNNTPMPGMMAPPLQKTVAMDTASFDSPDGSRQTVTAERPALPGTAQPALPFAPADYAQAYAYPQQPHPYGAPAVQNTPGWTGVKQPGWGGGALPTGEGSLSSASVGLSSASVGGVETAAPAPAATKPRGAKKLVALGLCGALAAAAVTAYVIGRQRGFFAAAGASAAQATATSAAHKPAEPSAQAPSAAPTATAATEAPAPTATAATEATAAPVGSSSATAAATDSARASAATSQVADKNAGTAPSAEASATHPHEPPQPRPRSAPPPKRRVVADPGF